MATKVKICGLKTEPALAAALAGGADYIGLVFFAPSPRALGLERARSLAGAARRAGTKVVALLVDADDRLIDGVVSAVEPLLLSWAGCGSKCGYGGNGWQR